MNDEEKCALRVLINDVLLEMGLLKMDDNKGVSRGSRGSVMGGSILPKPTFGTPSNIGDSNVEGSSIYLPRLDHVHNHPAGLGFDLHHDHYARFISTLWGRSSPGHFATGSIWAWAIEIPFKLTVDALGIIIQDQDAGVNFRMAMYEDNGYACEGANLLRESASTAMPGGYQKARATIADLTLDPAMYWLTVQVDGATWLEQLDHGGKGGFLPVSERFDRVYGAFPDPMPDQDGSMIDCPMMFVQVKSVP